MYASAFLPMHVDSSSCLTQVTYVCPPVLSGPLPHRPGETPENEDLADHLLSSARLGPRQQALLAALCHLSDTSSISSGGAARSGDAATAAESAASGSSGAEAGSGSESSTSEAGAPPSSSSDAAAPFVVFGYGASRKGAPAGAGRGREPPPLLSLLELQEAADEGGWMPPATPPQCGG